jgi:4-amino-4-deoxy-L-arabinose transferase-like glycosyltransferase
MVVFTIGLRFYALGEWSFWGDEYITVRRALGIFGTNLSNLNVSLAATNLALNFWGVSEWSARLVAAVIGVLTVPVLYYFAAKVFGWRVAAIASLLLAVSPWHIYWSQNARFYTALLLFFTVALFLFYWGIERDNPRYLLLSLGFLGLATLERPVALFLVPITAIYLVLVKLSSAPAPPGLRLRNLLLYYGPGIVGAIALMFRIPTFRSVASFREIFGFTNTNPLWILGGVVFYLGLPLICAAAGGAYFMLKHKRRAGLLLSVAAVLPTAAIFVVSLFQYSANRYAFVSLTSVVVLAAVAVNELWQATAKGNRLVAASFALILLAVPMGDNYLYYTHQNGNRDNWKDAFALIATMKEPGDLVVTTHRELANYYLGESTVGLQSVSFPSFVSDKARVWFLVDVTTLQKAPQAHRWILANTHLISTLDVNVSARTFPMSVHLYIADYPPHH